MCFGALLYPANGIDVRFREAKLIAIDPEIFSAIGFASKCEVELRINTFTIDVVVVVLNKFE